MSNFLSFSKTLDLLMQLKNAVRDCSARAERLEEHFAHEASTVDWEIDQQLGAINSRVTAEIAGIDAALKEHTVAFQSRRQQRHDRLQRARRLAQKQHLKTIEAQEGRKIFEAQRELIQTERNHDSAIEQLEKKSKQFEEELAHEQLALENLEQQTRKAFRGYPAFRRLLDSPPAAPPPELSSDEQRLLNDLRSTLDQEFSRLKRFKLAPLPLLFRFIPVQLAASLIAGAHVAAVFVLPRFGIHTFTWPVAGISLVVSLVVLTGLYLLGRLISSSKANAIAAELARARHLFDACRPTASANHQHERENIETETQHRKEAINASWKRAVDEAAQSRNQLQTELDEKLRRASASADRVLQESLERTQRDRDTKVAHLETQAATERKQLEQVRSSRKQQIESEQQQQWQALQTEWRDKIDPIYSAFDDSRTAAQRAFPDWADPAWTRWTAPQEFASAAPFARFDVDVEQLSESKLRPSRLPLPGPSQFSLPLLLSFPHEGSILFEATDRDRDTAIAALNNLVLRLLAASPPGRVVFTILDPVDLGQNFAGLMHLTDHEDRLINRRIWTQPDQIEQRLAELSEHIEKVTQIYLRNEYATIADYNQQAGRIAEPYHFLVNADFPANFSDLALRRLQSIAMSGPRCGVFTLIHSDQRQRVSREIEDIKKNSIALRGAKGRFFVPDQPASGLALVLETPPNPELATELLDKIGRSSIDFNRVEMPFSEIAPNDAEFWSIDTANEVRVPIGRTGATKFQYLALGKGTRQHVLVAGKTGSGKSTLFHVMITNLALWCSPDQIEFYLVDFKKGVEFKRYASSRLPHARVVAIESDREFGLSVLERIDQEIRRRGDLFRQLGVQDLPGYKKAGGNETLPRTILIIDEFHEFFVEDDRVASNAALLLDRLVRQGRAFGIHVILGSQTLGGAYALARTTLGQMVVRIALQCNEADALLIMDDTNPAPRLLSRPGEAIYNDAAGAIEGNSPFQVVWLSDEERTSWLARIRQRADASPALYPAPIVFEGNVPADVHDNHLLQHPLQVLPAKRPSAGRIWLGAPNSIKGPTEVEFRRHSGQNLLVVGQHDEAAASIVAVALISLAGQYPPNSVRFVLLDVTPAESRFRDFLDHAIRAIRHPVAILSGAELSKITSDLAAELDSRSESGASNTAPDIYLLVHHLERFKALKYEDELAFSLEPDAASNPGMQFDRIIREGAPAGIHTICTADSLNSVNRFLSRKALSEFDLRVLFQMSAADSATLTDSPRAVQLGMHRALLYNGQAGTLETFRPYSLPAPSWIDALTQSH